MAYMRSACACNDLLTLGATVMLLVVVHKPRVWSRLGKFALAFVWCGQAWMASGKVVLIQAGQTAARSSHLARTHLEARTARVLRVRCAERPTAAGWRSVHAYAVGLDLTSSASGSGLSTGEDLTEACEGLAKARLAAFEEQRLAHEVNCAAHYIARGPRRPHRRPRLGSRPRAAPTIAPECGCRLSGSAV